MLIGLIHSLLCLAWPVVLNRRKSKLMLLYLESFSNFFYKYNNSKIPHCCAKYLLSSPLPHILLERAMAQIKIHLQITKFFILLKPYEDTTFQPLRLRIVNISIVFMLLHTHVMAHECMPGVMCTLYNLILKTNWQSRHF